MRATVSEALITNSDAFYRWGGRVPILLGAAGHRNIGSRDARLADAMKDEFYLRSPKARTVWWRVS